MFYIDSAKHENRYLSFDFFFFTILTSFGQENYPIPPKSENRLFYIQHSNNHNTFVYDAIFSGSNFDLKKPVNSYRIVYTDGGVKKPLTEIQKKMAYGLDIKKTGNNIFEMYLAVSKDVKLVLFLNEKGQPKVWTIINNKKIILSRIFVQIKKGSSSLKPAVENVIFEGTDFTSGSKLNLVK